METEIDLTVNPWIRVKVEKASLKDKSRRSGIINDTLIVIIKNSEWE